MAIHEYDGPDDGLGDFPTREVVAQDFAKLSRYLVKKRSWEKALDGTALAPAYYVADVLMHWHAELIDPEKLAAATGISVHSAKHYVGAYKSHQEYVDAAQKRALN